MSWPYSYYCGIINQSIDNFFDMGLGVGGVGLNIFTCKWPHLLYDTLCVHARCITLLRISLFNETPAKPHFYFLSVFHNRALFVKNLGGGGFSSLSLPVIYILVNDLGRNCLLICSYMSKILPVNVGGQEVVRACLCCQEVQAVPQV